MRFEGYNNRFLYSEVGGLPGVHYYLRLLSDAGVNMVYVSECRGTSFGLNSSIYNTVFVDRGITPDVLREHAFRTDLFIIEKRGPTQNFIGWSKREGINIPFLFLQGVKRGTKPKRDVTMDTDWYFYQINHPSLSTLLNGGDDKWDNYAFTDLATGHSQTIATFNHTLMIKEKIREYYEIHGRKDSMSGGTGLPEV